MGGRGGGREGEEDMYVTVPLNSFYSMDLMTLWGLQEYKSEGVSEGGQGEQERLVGRGKKLLYAKRGSHD